MRNWNVKEFNIQTFIYYLIYSGARNAFHKTMLHKEVWLSLKYRDIYHFKKLS